MISSAQLKSLLDDLTDYLSHTEDPPVLRYSNEISPHSIQFSYEPPEKNGANEERSFAREVEPSRPRVTERSFSPESVAQEIRKTPPKETQKEQPANVRCTLCGDRMYPVRRFYISGNKPVLVLHYSGAVQGNMPNRDRSDKTIFGSPEEDDLFRRMLEASGLALNDPHYQEYPACHFNPARSLPEEWNERCSNCLLHLENTIKRENIQLVIITGYAAIFLMSEEMAKKHSKSGEPILLDFAGKKLPFLVLRSPSALLAYEKKRLKLKADASAEGQQAYQAVVEEEKSVKRAILQSLQKVKSEYLR